MNRRNLILLILGLASILTAVIGIIQRKYQVHAWVDGYKAGCLAASQNSDDDEALAKCIESELG